MENKKVLVLGSGAIRIGQAGEFDYSGTQALKALRKMGVISILINPNVATVQTSEGLADKCYFWPINEEYVSKVIEIERPNGVMLGFGGQTALNCGIQLWRNGLFKKYNVEVLGTPINVIEDTEDRQRFIDRMKEICLKTVESESVSNINDAKVAARRIGYPIIVRTAFALGGRGSGFAKTDKELELLCKKAFSFSSNVLIEKSLCGWKEIEFEVIRDNESACIPVCDMENFDPLGVHTGDSIVVSPCQSINQNVRKRLGNLSVQIVNHLGIIGECNVQIALSPNSEDYRIIEVNARLSRSSALASKASGYPLAYVAAMLNLGYRISDIEAYTNKSTLSFLDFSYDRIVCKIPRWDFTKFPGANRGIGPCMTSVGEIMSIGGTFEEAIQKGLRMLEQNSVGLVGNNIHITDIERELKEPTDIRIFAIAEALNNGMSIRRINKLTGIDFWFLKRLCNIVHSANRLRKKDKIEDLSKNELRFLKRLGFSDIQIAQALYKNAYTYGISEECVRDFRKSKGILPVVKSIQTLWDKISGHSNYFYLSYSDNMNEAPNIKDNNSVVILGGGAYRIGSSVEFDWCCVSCIKEVRKQGLCGVMVNCNPETVSTDYDECDRLYFEEMSIERIMDIIEYEKPYGVIVSVGGQRPNDVALSLSIRGVPLLGSPACSIDCTEDRHKFSALIDSLQIDQPEWEVASSVKEINSFILKVGFPVLVRPSHVLSGAAMSVCYNKTGLRKCLKYAARISKLYPIVISKFYEGWNEIEIDAVANCGKILYSALSEHIEHAGVHSGDATIVFPSRTVESSTSIKANEISTKIADALQITGPFNIQFLANGQQLKVIECNMRASRTFPFISKVLGYNLISMATKALLGANPIFKINEPHKIGVKIPFFSFSRIKGVDPILGVEMQSTGEVCCIEDTFEQAFLLAEMAVGLRIPSRMVLISVGVSHITEAVEMCNSLRKLGVKLLAPNETCKSLTSHGLPVQRVMWSQKDYQCPSIKELIAKKCLDLIICIPDKPQDGLTRQGFLIRRAAIDYNIPLITDECLAKAYIATIENVGLTIRSANSITK